MPIPNPSFEDPGANPGEADQWTSLVITSGYDIADFAEGGIPKPVEDFEGSSWGTGAYVHTVTGSSVLFDVDDAPQPSNAETFDRWNFNIGYKTVVTGGVAVVFDGGELAETFEANDWGTDPYVTTLAISPTITETFEAPGWGVYITEITSGTVAQFDQGTVNYEDFEEVEGDLLFIVDDETTGLCAVPTGVHGKINGDKVTVLTTGTRPLGLAANAIYYVIVVSTTTFRLSKTNGGPAVTFGDLGIGSHYLHADETEFWTLTE